MLYKWGPWSLEHRFYQLAIFNAHLRVPVFKFPSLTLQSTRLARSSHLSHHLKQGDIFSSMTLDACGRDWRPSVPLEITPPPRWDGITGRVLRSCADQLAGLFTSIFNESLATSVIPTSFKKSVIIPVPKNSKPSCLNDYRPVALTSTVMKVFERLLKKHICSSIPATLDPLQFAYRPNRSTDDAISQVLHSSLTHIDSKNGNYVRLLFIDYSSTFNTIVPTKLAVKLSDLGLNTSLCDWIQDFLTGRPQVVKMGQFTSNSITLNVGAPQGCVLSPLLYSL